MPTVEKEAPPPVRVTDRPGFKRFMHEWEEKLHHELATQDEQRERRRKPEHKKAA